MPTKLSKWNWRSLKKRLLKEEGKIEEVNFSSKIYQTQMLEVERQLLQSKTVSQMVVQDKVAFLTLGLEMHPPLQAKSNQWKKNQE